MTEVDEMQYMVIFTPAARFATEGLPPDFWDVELEEQAQARVLYAAGRLRQTWALGGPDQHGAVVLFEAGDRESLEAAIVTFPFVKLDYYQYRVLPMASYPGFVSAGGASGES